MQELLAGIEPPLNVTDEASDVSVPLHVVLGVEEISTPLGHRVDKRAGQRSDGVIWVGQRNSQRREPTALMVAGLNALLTVWRDGFDRRHASRDTETVLEIHRYRAVLRKCTTCNVNICRQCDTRKRENAANE